MGGHRATEVKERQCPTSAVSPSDDSQPSALWLPVVLQRRRRSMLVLC